MKFTKICSLSLALLTFAALLPSSVAAERHADHRYWHGDIRAFHRSDMDRWRGGHWVHGEHNGRVGWWWVITTAGLWYLYSQPVYPYPSPYVPPAAVVVPPTGPAPTAYWYYCASAKTYYPYVVSCPEGWRAVPATPPAQ